MESTVHEEVENVHHSKLKASQIIVLGLFIFGMASLGAAQDLTQQNSYDVGSTTGETDVYTRGVSLIESDSTWYLGTADEEKLYDMGNPFNSQASEKVSGYENIAGVVKKDGNYYVANPSRDQVIKFDSSWNKLDTYSFGGSTPTGITMMDDNIFLYFKYDQKIIEYDDSWSSQTTIDVSSELDLVANSGLSSLNGLLYVVTDEIYEYDRNGYTGNSYSFSGSHNNGLETTDSKTMIGDGGDTVYEFDSIPQNKDPDFNSLSVSPDPPLIGENVSYGAEASDPDGSIEDLELTVFQDGSQVYQDSVSQASHNWSDVDTPDSEGDLDARFVATDDAEASTTEWLNRTLENNAPSVSLNDPGNSTYWSYDVPLSFSVNDEDSNPNESLYCEVYKDGSLDRNVTGLSESDSYSDTLRSDLGSHSVSVECSDPAGNTEAKNQSYNVKDFKINSVSSQSDVYETTDVGYSLDYRTGDMIDQNNSEIILTWNGSSQSYEFNLSSSEDALETVQKTIPLIKSNNSNYNWDIEARYNASKINGGTEIRRRTSDTKSQTGLQAYKFNEHELKDGFTQLEASDLEYTASINKLEGSAGGAFTGETTFSQTNKTKLLNEDSGLVFSNVFESDLIDSSSSSFDLETVFTLSFDGDTRQIVDSKSVQLDKIVLDKTTGEQTLSIETRDEVNNSLQNSNLEMGLQVNNPDSPDSKRFYGFEFNNSDTHSISIQPSYAEVTANAFQKRNIDYQNQDLDYPKRRHFLLSETLNNQTTQIDLYMLKNSEARNVEFELLDADLNPLEQHVIRIERAFPSLEETRTVAMVKTGSEGLANTFVDVEEQYIFTVFDSEGNLKDQIGPQSITGLTTTLEIDPELPPGLENLKRQVRFTDVQENNDSLVVDYISETERLNNIYLTAKKDNLFNTEIIDTDSSIQPQGQLEVTGFNASNESVYYNLIGTFGDSNVTLDSGRYGTDSGSYGDTGMFMSLIFILALIISGLFRPSAAIGMGVIGIFVLSFIGFLPIGQTALISIAVLGAILVWRMS